MLIFLLAGSALLPMDSKEWSVFAEWSDARCFTGEIEECVWLLSVLLAL